MLPVALCVIECACMRTGFFDMIWDYCDERREASMHKHQRGLYGSHSWGDKHHNATGWPQRSESYPCRKLCRRIRATGRLVWREKGLDAELLKRKGSKQVSKPLTAAKTSGPRTSTDSEDVRGGLHWSKKSVPSTGQSDRAVLYGAKKEQMKKMCQHSTLSLKWRTIDCMFFFGLNVA